MMEKLYHDNQVERSRFEHGFVTIGCCGFPNVGKSSLLNSLNGRKVVSVSKTPGHTKHLQTIFLTKTVRLCDCPGLVFPSLVTKPLQILAGMYPIAQLQEPYSAIRYISERIPIVCILKLKHPEIENNKEEAKDNKWSDREYDWSPLDICEGWAVKRGYFTAKACRPDVYRAANEILRMSLDGRLCLSLLPPKFTKEKELWECHQETKELNDIVHNVEFTAKQDKDLYNRFRQNTEDCNDDDEQDSTDSQNDEFKCEFESADDNEKKDDDDDSNGSEEADLKTHKNPYDLLNNTDDF
jgi:ribosome biogenesis GTPase A